MRILTVVSMAVFLLLTGCLAVMGREPTQEEIDALMRGEKLPPRDGAKDKDGKRPPDRPPDKPPEPEAQPVGPAGGIVLRWMDAATLTVDCDGKLEVVRLAGVTIPTDDLAAERVRMRNNDEYPYGTKITLTYPTKDKAGNVLYRDEDERLVANITRTAP